MNGYLNGPQRLFLIGLVGLLGLFFLVILAATVATSFELLPVSPSNTPAPVEMASPTFTSLPPSPTWPPAFPFTPTNTPSPPPTITLSPTAMPTFVYTPSGPIRLQAGTADIYAGIGKIVGTPGALLTLTAATPLPTGISAVCGCYDDAYNCDDFKSHSNAQTCYVYCLLVSGDDIHHLDPDGDGLACEDLP